MKLYHGSPKKLKVLLPHKAKGIVKFESQKAIFLTKSFKQAALYAIGKSLKKPYALPPNKLVIVGKKKLRPGYVYEVNLKADEVEKGPFSDYEFSYKKPIKEFKLHKVSHAKYRKDIIFVKTKEELMNFIKI